MHVLMTVNAAWNLANFRRGLIEALLAEGNIVTVLAPEDEHVRTLTGMGCRFVPLEMDVKGLSPRRDLTLAVRFLRHFRRERPDVILSYTIKNNIFASFAAGALGIPFVPTITGLGTAFLSGSLLQNVAERLYRAAFRNATEVFFQNGDDRAFFLERGLVEKGRARLVPGSGIDLTRFGPSDVADSGSAATFLLIGRLLRDKGVLEYVEAARMMKARYPETRFWLLGQVGVENRSAIGPETVAAWEADGTVSHLGFMPDPRPVIAEADCIVLPSYREGTPRTLLEGAAMGRPLITTDVPGCRSVVEDGATGFLCDARSAASLYDAMIRFMEAPHHRRVAMGRAGRVKMEQEYDVALVINAYRKALAPVYENGHGQGKRTPVEVP